MRGLGLALALFVTPLAAAAAEPQAPAAPSPGKTVEPLVVSPPPAARDVDTLAQKFSRALSEPSRTGQLSRWATRPCPRALGLARPYDAFVEQRIASIAEQAGAPKANRPCAAPNIFVLFTDKPQRLIDAVAARRPAMLGFHYAAQTKRLTTYLGPVQAWYVTATANHAESDVDDEFYPTPGGEAGSRLSERLQSRFEYVMVVVDASKMAGQPIGRVADDAAMFALARSPWSLGCHDLPTVLDALKAACPASAGLEVLTDADLAYLKGLYAIDPEAFFGQQRGAIGARVAQTLGGKP